MNKPVYVLAVHNKIKKAGNDSLQIPPNLTEGVDTQSLLDTQRKAGLLKLAVSNKLKVELANAMAAVIPKLEGNPDELQAAVDDLAKESTDVINRLASLPNIFAALSF